MNTLMNVEIKARCKYPDFIRDVLKQHDAWFMGVDNQKDTYFNVNHGRLKLREGNIEKHLIFYNRPDTDSPRKSDVILYDSNCSEILKSILEASLGIKVVVNKVREIYFIDNIKFHIDEVDKLGSFVEIEAMDVDERFGEKKLHQQCDKFIRLFKLGRENFINVSYSDMLLSHKK